MNYIVLDLEWNQAYMQKAMAVQKRLCARLRGEVIQIGAVKLNERLDICGSYSIIVKPKYFTKIHRHVMLLTGITQQKMDAGVLLPDAAESFRRFCGENFAFLTWGPDDIPMLKENFNVNSLSTDWLDRVYDLQTIYAQQTGGEKRQVSLEDAMAALGIEQTLPAHDALNDAYFTALVAKRLDIAGGIARYNPNIGKSLFSLTLGDADVGERGYTGFSSLNDFEGHGVISCPFCKKKMAQDDKTLHMKGQRYLTLMSCAEHGKMFVTARLSHNMDSTYRIKFSIEAADDEKISSYKTKLSEAEQYRKANSQRKRRPYKRKRKTESTAPVK